MFQDYPFTPEEFKTIYSQVPRLTVEAVIRSEQGVLLTLRNLESWNNLWHMPGGTVYYRESLRDALHRIVSEELGVNIIVGPVIDYIEYYSEAQQRGYGYSVGVAFSCTMQVDVPKQTLQGEAIEIFQQLPENIVPEHAQFLLKHQLIKHTL